MSKWLILVLVLVILFTGLAPAGAQEDDYCMTVQGIEICGEREDVLDIAAGMVGSLTTAPAAPAQTTSTTSWMQVQVGKYNELVAVDGQSWELVMGTYQAVTTANGRYEAVTSSPAGPVNGTDYGWCGATQYDCPPHGLLVRVEVPAEHVSCMTATMDISWRIRLENICGGPVSARISVRYNNVTRTGPELLADYLSLAGGLTQVTSAKSELGLFVSVEETGQSQLTYQNVSVPFGYSCWDCLADTRGEDEPVPVPLDNISTFGPDTAPSGSSLIPGIVFPLPRPTDAPFALSFEVTVVDSVVVWAGRYDVAQ